MNNCPICDVGRLIIRTSSKGEETFCVDCRRIVVSSSLGFFFTASGDDGVEDCKGPDNDPRPGFKGPGARAKCHLYDPGDDAQKNAAMQRAKNSAYSSQHRKGASKVVNALFTLNPAGNNLIGNTAEADAAPTTLQSGGGGPARAADKSVIDRDNPVSVTAPNGVQPDSNQNANELSSGTTSSKTVLSLFQELDYNSDHMGMPRCTMCETRHHGECKTADQAY